jgi:hypothetical protein
MAANCVLEHKSRHDSRRFAYSEAMGRRFHERGSNPHA